MNERKPNRLLFSLVVIAIVVPTTFALAHPGRTDSYGCHTCRTNCPSWGLDYGEYHCHRAKALPQPKAPIKSHYGESGSGYTEPAPEYTKSVVPKAVLRVEAERYGELSKISTTTKKSANGFWERLFTSISGLFR